MPIDSHIGQYKILDTLGAGGMGTVYLGEHLLLGRRAAIKTLSPLLSSHREVVDRFFTEARAISAVKDPGVVQIFDFGYHVDGTAYIVMELLEGESLQARIERLGTLPVPEALRITRQIASSLAAAHARGIVHRDLKPGNVFLIKDPEAQGGERTKILDFGICKLEDRETAQVTQAGMMLGTPVYMSPEQCRAGHVDHRSDIYSVGCALFHMLTGRPPFDHGSVGEIISAHLREQPPAPSELAPELPVEVDALVLDCIAKQPDERFQTMRELQSAVDGVLDKLDAEPITEDSARIRRLRRSGQTTQPPPPTDPWFVESLPPVPAADIAEEWPTSRTSRGFGRMLLYALALFGGLAAGIAVATFAFGRGGVTAPVVELSPWWTPVAEPVEPATAATAHEISPTIAEDEPIDEIEAIADEQLADDEPRLTQDVPVEKPAPKVKPRHRTIHKARPPPPREEPEDLYDTR